MEDHSPRVKMRAVLDRLRAVRFQLYEPLFIQTGFILGCLLCPLLLDFCIASSRGALISSSTTKNKCKNFITGEDLPQFLLGLPIW